MKIILNSSKSIPSIKLIGGKAQGLHELQSILGNVPKWGTITTLFFDEVVESNKGLYNLISEEKDLEIYEYFLNLEFSDSQESLLKDLWKELSNHGKQKLAVRSSAIDEDGLELSFAGQMDSFLNISSFECYLDAVRGCLASLYGERAIAYRKQNNIDPYQAKIAVVVQEMIPAEISGVLFSANPLNGSLDQMLVTSTYGLGEGIVSGNLNTDTFTINYSGKVLSEEIAIKDTYLSSDHPNKVNYRETESERVNQPSLDNIYLKKLSKLAAKATLKKGIPLDIEFSIYKNKIYFLQARPITSLNIKENLKIWDNSNIVESYSGVTTPLTFSFIQNAYYAVYCQFCNTIGVSQKEIFKNRHILQNMLGLINGRVYYNLINWYKLISLMPGFNYNKKFMEQMMGLSTIPSDINIKKSNSLFHKYLIDFPKLIFVGSKMVIAHLMLPRKVNAFQKNFKKLYKHYSSIDFKAKSPFELIKIYRELEEKILWNWKSPITNDFEAMIFYGLLKKFTIKWKVDPKGILQNDLLTGEGGICSTDLINALATIALNIEKDSALKAKLINLSPEEAYKTIQHDKFFEEIHKQLNDYLEKYGVRCINEMKLESVPIKDNPLFCISTILSYLCNGVFDPKEQNKKEKELRSNAETTLEKNLPGKRLTIYKWILKNTRRAIKNRENQRFARTQGYDLVRSIFKSIGKTWEEKDIIKNSEDIFYLTIPEIFSYIEGTSTLTNLPKLIQARKDEFLNFNSLNPDDHIETTEEVYFNNIFEQPITSESESLIKGLGCCSGIIEKRVKVVLSPDKDLKLNKEIMVAKQTDPGWGILFPSVGGLIIEKGSMLSHSAIVAREMGIPAVIGVKNATKILKDGTLVRLDGSMGTIEIIEEEK